ncbi:MAG: hypothetical protein ABGW87_00105 [Sphingomonadaceae bacterium]
MQPEEARTTLAGVSGVEARLAEKLTKCPPWRHAAFGMLLGILVASIAISGTAQIIGTVVVLTLVGLLLWHDLRRYGVFVNGYRRGATLPVALAYVGTLVVLIAAAMYMRENDFSIWSKLGLGAIAFAWATFTSVQWNRAYRKELRGGSL